MPDAGNFTERSPVINSIDNSIGPKDDLANVVIPIFRDDATRIGEVGESVQFRDQFISKRHCPVRIVASYEDDDVVKIVSCSGATKVVYNREAKLPFYLVMGNAFALC